MALTGRIIARVVDARDPLAECVRDTLHKLRYGVVSLIVQRGDVVRIERAEECRLRRPEEP